MTIGSLYFGYGHGKMGIFVIKFRGKIFISTILTMQNLDFGHGYGRNFDHLTMVMLKFGHGHGQKFLTI